MSNNPKLLIIGGFGFLGSNLLDRFLSSNKYEIIVFEFNNVAPKQPTHFNRVKVYYGDFNNPKDLEQIFSEHKIEIVLHLITTTVPATSNANIPYDIQSNLVDTIHLLEMMRQYHVGKIVFLSSGGTIYGLPVKAPTKETDPTDPICSYGITKLAIEKYLQLFHHLYGLDYLILRPSNPFGPYHTSTKQGLINVMLRKIIAKEPITIWGDGNIVRDYLYVGDFSESVFQLIDSGVSGEIVNVGSGFGHSVKDILAIMGNHFSGLDVIYLPSRGFDIQKLVLDTQKMNRLCQIHYTGLEEGILKTYAWMKRQMS